MSGDTVSGTLERFVYGEARLLDQQRFDEWLELLTDDVVYWVPNYAENGTVAEHGVIVREDLSGLKARVARIKHLQNPTQMPPPRTIHFLTNVIATEEPGGPARLSANLLLYVSKDQRVTEYPARLDYELREISGAWRISKKTINLIANDLPLNQLPLI